MADLRPESSDPPQSMREDKAPQAAKASMRSPQNHRTLLERYLVVWLCLLSALAMFWPRWLGDVDPFVGSAGSIAYLIAATMFFVGWMLPKHQVDEVLKRAPLVGQGVALQYLSMPLLAWALAILLGLTGANWTGMMLVGAVPGAMASNVLTLNARGNASYSVSLTTVATMLSPFVVPFALYVTLGENVKYDPVTVVQSLATRVVLPVLAGHALRRLRPQWTTWAERLGPLAANLTILWIIAIVVAKNRDRLSEPGVLTLMGPLLALNVLGYVAGYGGGVLMGAPEPMRRALTLEVGMQNAGVGTMLALDMFPGDPAVALPPAVYTFGCMLTGSVLARWWGGRPTEASTN